MKRAYVGWYYLDLDNGYGVPRSVSFNIEHQASWPIKQLRKLDVLCGLHEELEVAFEDATSEGYRAGIIRLLRKEFTNVVIREIPEDEQ